MNRETRTFIRAMMILSIMVIQSCGGKVIYHVDILDLAGLAIIGALLLLVFILRITDKSDKL